MKKAELKVRLPVELKAAIDQVRGVESGNSWVVHAIQEKLEVQRITIRRRMDADPEAEPVVMLEVKSKVQE